MIQARTGERDRPKQRKDLGIGYFGASTGESLRPVAAGRGSPLIAGTADVQRALGRETA
jgi:hypothetical protein